MVIRTSILMAFLLALFSFAPLAADTADITEIGTLKPNGIRHVNVTEAQTLITQTPESIVLDVRTGREFRGGHIDGAININYFSPAFRRNIRALDPSKTYLIHCKSGHRSGRAAPIMKDEGIDVVVHMDGGFDAWKEAGLPVETQ